LTPSPPPRQRDRRDALGVEREEYGPLGGLFTAPVVPNAFTAEPEEAGRRVGICVPEGFRL
jgi:hypothetical protein